MKVNVSDKAARKALDMIPADTQDPDLLQLKDRLKKGLAASATDQQLTADELEVLTVLLTLELRTPHFLGSDPAIVARRALPKLNALKARRRAEGGV